MARGVDDELNSVASGLTTGECEWFFASAKTLLTAGIIYKTPQSLALRSLRPVATGAAIGTAVATGVDAAWRFFSLPRVL